MSFDTLIFGSLTVAPPMLESWLSTPVRPADFAGWPELFAGDFAARAPEVLIEQLREQVLQPHELFELEHDGGELSVRAMLSTESFLEALLPLATLWRSAQGSHGAGSLQMFGQTSLDFAYRVEVGMGRSGVAVLSAKAKKSAQATRQWKAVDAHAQASLRNLLGDTGKARRGPNPFTGR